MKVSVWPHTTMVLNLTSPEDVLLVSSSTDWDWANLHNFGGFFFPVGYKECWGVKGEQCVPKPFPCINGRIYL